ncbi:hypothetical protein B0H14DRAFT_2652552 [Mycena olivaceomarginata]|nr:hypothetical protein B0H14DRAFT_2652552 [Mycena olivaceomarginata]
MLRSSFVALVSLLGSVSVANAWFRVSCTDPLVQERLDPIISPGGNPSQHTSNPTYSYDNLRASNCTNCLVAQTKLFEPVANGGLLVYYQESWRRRQIERWPRPQGIPSWPAHDHRRPETPFEEVAIGLGTQEELRERAIQWSCLRYTVGLPGYDDNGTGFPTTDCESGLNSRLHMPACWDGINLDSADHVSHLFFEVTWDVADFSGRWNPSVDKWPFVYSTGDPTASPGTGTSRMGAHSYSSLVEIINFLNIRSFSWDTTALQNAIDQCNNPNDQTGQGRRAAAPERNGEVTPVQVEHTSHHPVEFREIWLGPIPQQGSFRVHPSFFVSQLIGGGRGGNTNNSNVRRNTENSVEWRAAVVVTITQQDNNSIQSIQLEIHAENILTLSTPAEDPRTGLGDLILQVGYLRSQGRDFPLSFGRLHIFRRVSSLKAAVSNIRLQSCLEALDPLLGAGVSCVRTMAVIRNPGCQSHEWGHNDIFWVCAMSAALSAASEDE